MCSSDLEWRGDVDRSDKAILAAYAVARLRDGSIVFEVLTRQEVDARRARSMSRENGPWVTDYARMARKTSLRALFTGGLVPMSAEIVRALEVDDEDNVIDVEVEKPTASVRSTAANSLRELAASQVQAEPEAEPEAQVDESPLADLKAELAECNSADAVQGVQNSWLKRSDESLHGDIKTLCKERAKAFWAK